MSGEQNLVYLHDNGEFINLSQRKKSAKDNEDEDDWANGAVLNDSKKESPLQKFLTNHHIAIKRGIALLIHIVVLAYLSYASYYFYTQELNNDFIIGKDGRCRGHCSFQWCHGYGMLLILFIIAYVGMLYFLLLKPLFRKQICNLTLKSFKKCFHALRSQRITFIILLIIGLIVLATFLYFEVRDDVGKLVSLIGPMVFVLIGFIFSTNRRAIPWSTVCTGIGLQFLLGVFCIRWEVGRKIFECIGNKVETFLKYAEVGSRFVYGDVIVDNKVFAFAVLPVIFFFSFCISILYYYGTMQWIIMKLGWILQTVLGTTVCESVNAAANIFLGMTEAPLLIRPYIKILTHSEIHSIMVSGFATVSGTVLAAYISFGAKPEHLITSSVMAAPATLAWSKLFYPEEEESQSKSDNIKMEKSQDSSVLDAGAKGANIAIEVILSITANLVAFVSFVAFLNGIVNWLGYLVGLDDLSFESIFSKIFMPLSWILGVPWKECDVVAQVIATKTIINEFVAYEKLGKFKDALLITGKSAGIATFAICGFANPSSLGICIGTLGAMAPERRSQITKVAFRSFVVGCIVCFCSASFAGLLMPEEGYDYNNSTTTITTTSTTTIFQGTGSIS